MTNPITAINQLLAAGMTQQVIAARARVNQSTVSRILSGDYDPKYSTAKRLIDLADGVLGPWRTACEVLTSSPGNQHDADESLTFGRAHL